MNAAAKSQIVSVIMLHLNRHAAPPNMSCNAISECHFGVIGT